jgi:hypothetical protein
VRATQDHEPSVFTVCETLASQSIAHPQLLQLPLQRDLVSVVDGSAAAPLDVVLRLLLYQANALQHIGDVIDATLLYLQCKLQKVEERHDVTVHYDDDIAGAGCVSATSHQQRTHAERLGGAVQVKDPAGRR